MPGEGKGEMTNEGECVVLGDDESQEVGSEVRKPAGMCADQIGKAAQKEWRASGEENHLAETCSITSGGQW